MMPRTQPLQRPAAMGLLMALIAIPAHANFIGFPAIFYMDRPWMFVLAFALIWTLGETLVIGILAKLPFKRVIWPVFLANLVSFIAGIPVSLINDEVYVSFLPSDFIGEIVWYPYLVLILVAIFFVVSVMIEFPMVNRSLRKSDPGPSRKRTAGAVLAANLLTYGIIGFWFYDETRPLDRVGPLMPDTAWAANPATRVYYIDSTRWSRLYTVLTNGDGRRLLVDDHIIDFQVVEETGVILYQTNADELKIQYPNRDQAIGLGTIENGIASYLAACNSAGSTVAFSPDSNFASIVVVDVASGNRSKFKPEAVKESLRESLMWSSDPAVFFFVRDGKATAFRVADDLTVQEVPIDGGTINLADVYVPDYLGFYSHWAREEVVVNPVPTKPTRIPAINFFSSRGRNSHIREVCVVGSGKEIIFTESDGIYVMRLENRMLGQLAEGWSMAVVADGYRKTFASK